MSKTMKSDKQALVPRLRFPEFRDAGEWANKSMGDLYGFHPTNTLSRDKLNYTNGDVKNIHYGDIHTKFATLFDVTNELVPFINDTESVERIRPESYCIESDVIFADASEDMEDVGKSIEIVNTNNEKIVSGLHTILARQLTNRLAIRFGGYLFKSGAIREQIKREAQGAKVLGISSGRLSRINVCYPPDREEQQKVAGCLSSLDALIAAQAEKIDALNTHKKGLMQQLFPREGETVPRLRFPEFQDAGEWDITPLGKAAKNLDSKRIPVTGSARAKGDVPYYGATGIIDYVQDYIFDEDLLCISEDGANLMARNYPIAFSISGKTWVNNHAHVLRFNSMSTQVMVENYLNSISVKDFLTGMAQPKLNRAKLDMIPIPLPGIEEQQKIANSLLSHEALITAHTEKLGVLKNHKKGLMQQLFPNSEPIK